MGEIISKAIGVDLLREDIRNYPVGSILLLSGKIYTARDQAHKRILEEVRQGNAKKFSFLKGKVIYYCGPSSFPTDAPIGSCGPTTSSRMDNFLEVVSRLEVVATIGKGERSAHAEQFMKEHRMRYLIAPGGAGAYLSTKVIASKLVMFEDLGPEAIYELVVEGFPVWVAW